MKQATVALAAVVTAAVVVAAPAVTAVGFMVGLMIILLVLLLQIILEVVELKIVMQHMRFPMTATTSLTALLVVSHLRGVRIMQRLTWDHLPIMAGQPKPLHYFQDLLV
jgi:hypothetical protein